MVFLAVINSKVKQESKCFHFVDVLFEDKKSYLYKLTNIGLLVFEVL